MAKEGIYDLISNFEEGYQGDYDDEEDFAREIVGELYDLPSIAKQYFDYEAFARDLFMTDYWFEEGFVLFKIILHDKDFVSFEIFYKYRKLLLTTHQFDQEQGVVIIQPAKVEHEEDIKWTNFNAYCTPMYIYEKKVEWKVNGRIFKTKKSDTAFADFTNRNIVTIIDKFIARG